MKIALIGLGKLGYPMSLFLSYKFEVNAYDKNKKAVIDNILNKRKKFQNSLICKEDVK
jgi:3-hydroxyisobutyrate dehydrogenase-like beta-hydroxyacid dehydrogenase